MWRLPRGLLFRLGSVNQTLTGGGYGRPLMVTAVEVWRVWLGSVELWQGKAEKEQP